ncbi:MAG: TolC family protein [Planctomycetota bacterium]|nr:TolC family protein [Planctomycetota bacterium]MDA0933865.1 TolC family protein [Planctomycetota bacterium]
MPLHPISRAGGLALCLLAACATEPIDRPSLEQVRRRGVFPDVPLDFEVEISSASVSIAPNLDELVRLSLARDPGIAAAFEEWRAALARVPQVGALPDPRLTWAHFLESIETRTGPQQDRVSVAQTFPWFGKLQGRVDVAAKHADALWWNVEARRAAVVLDVHDAYYEYARLGRDIGLTRDNLELLQSLEPVVQRRVQGGGAQAPLLQLQVEIGKLEDQLAGFEAFRPAVAARLLTRIDLEEFGELAWPDLEVPAPLPGDLGSWLREMAEGNPELRGLTEAVAREDARVISADRESLPDVTVGVDWLRTGDARMPGVVGSGDDPFAVSVGVNLPIGRAKYRAIVDEAEAGRASARQKLERRIDELAVALRHARFQHDDAARQIGLYRDTLLPRARQALSVTQAAYGQGGAVLLDVIDRQRALLAFEQAYWRACAELGRSRARIESILGRHRFLDMHEGVTQTTEGSR